MTYIPSIPRIALLLALLLPAAAGPSRAQFHGHTGGLQVHHAWVRATPPGVTMSAMYGTLVNPTDAPARLVAVSCPLAAAVEIHEVVRKGGMLHMQPVRGGVTVPARGEFSLAPGGFHLMLIGLRAPLKPGDTVPLAFRFADGKELKVQAVASAEGRGMGGMPHGHPGGEGPHGHDAPGMPHGPPAPGMPHDPQSAPHHP